MCEAPVTDDIEDEDEEDDEEMTRQQKTNFQLQDEGKEVLALQRGPYTGVLQIRVF